VIREEARPARPARPGSQLPEPGRFWVRYLPKTWETPDRPWVHLAGAKLGEWARRGAPRPALESLSDTPLDDVLYIPPVPAKRGAARDELATARLVDGTPVLVQLFPGEEPKIPPVQGVTFVFDLLAVLMDGDLGRLDRLLPTGASVVWPLIPGLTDDPSLWDEGCRRLAMAGARCAQALAPVLSPADRHRVLEELESRDELFDALFHREPPPERDFARVAHRHGLDPFLARPLPRAPIVGRENRRIGEVLALIAELWLRLGRPVEQGQAFYRSARWVDETTYDLDALAHEGNLAVIKAFDERSVAAVAEVAETGESELLAELLAEYVAPQGPEGEGT
jgi:hypothetical protein